MFILSFTQINLSQGDSLVRIFVFFELEKETIIVTIYLSSNYEETPLNLPVKTKKKIKRKYFKRLEAFFGKVVYFTSHHWPKKFVKYVLFGLKGINN